MKQHKFDRMDKGAKRVKAEPTDRCQVTGNPFGTDTWAVGHECQCAPCQVWLKAVTPSKPAPNPTGICNVLAGLDDNVVLERIANGENASTLAQELGVHKSAISHRYAGNPQYIAARELGSECRLDTVQEQIATATDPFNLARARELFRAVSWRAEREFPGKWGQKQEVKHTLPQGPLLSITLSQPSPVPALDHNTITIDSQPVDSNDV